MASKSTFIDRLVGLATTLAETAEGLASIENTYFDRGYNGGGADPITAPDIPSKHGTLTATDIANFITLIQQFNNFRNNAAVTTGDYDNTLNDVRDDL